MTIREKIIAEMEESAPFSKQAFMGYVQQGIITNGEFSFTVDGRKEKTFCLSQMPWIPSKWLTLVQLWVAEEGLTMKKEHTSWGVSEYIITL